MRVRYTHECPHRMSIASAERISDKMDAQIVVIKGPRTIFLLICIVWGMLFLSFDSGCCSVGRRDKGGEFVFGDGSAETLERAPDEGNDFFRS